MVKTSFGMIADMNVQFCATMSIIKTHANRLCLEQGVSIQESADMIFPLLTEMIEHGDMFPSAQQSIVKKLQDQSAPKHHGEYRELIDDVLDQLDGINPRILSELTPAASEAFKEYIACKKKYQEQRQKLEDEMGDLIIEQCGKLFTKYPVLNPNTKK